MSHRNPRVVETLATVGRKSDMTRQSGNQNSPYFIASHMLPREDGTLEVIAECEEHFTRQSQADVWNGVLAPCPRNCLSKPKPKDRGDASRERDRLRKQRKRALQRAS